MTPQADTPFGPWAAVAQLGSPKLESVEWKSPFSDSIKGVYLSADWGNTATVT